MYHWCQLALPHGGHNDRTGKHVLSSTRAGARKWVFCRPTSGSSAMGNRQRNDNMCTAGKKRQGTCTVQINTENEGLVEGPPLHPLLGDLDANSSSSSGAWGSRPSPHKVPAGTTGTHNSDLNPHFQPWWQEVRCSTAGHLSGLQRALFVSGEATAQ